MTNEEITKLTKALTDARAGKATDEQLLDTYVLANTNNMTAARNELAVHLRARFTPTRSHSLLWGMLIGSAIGIGAYRFFQRT